MHKYNLIIFKFKYLYKIFKELNENLNFNLFEASNEKILHDLSQDLKDYIIITKKNINYGSNQLILKNEPNVIVKKFVYEVKILKSKYLQMIKDRYISTLLNITNKQIKNGIVEIRNNYGNLLKFKDRLICFIIKNY